MASSDLRARILKVAGEQFLQHGFHKVSIDSLVAKLRTSKSSIYKYFDSKDALIKTLVEEVHAIIDHQLEQIIDHPELGFEDKLHHTARITEKISRLINARFLEDLRIHTPEIWALHRNREQQRFQHYYRRLFEQGQREGIIRLDMDLDFLTTVYLHIIALGKEEDDLQPLPYHSGELIEYVTTLFLEGALSP